MSEFERNMNDVLEIPHQELMPVEEPDPTLPVVITGDAKDDFDYSRTNYYNLIDKGSEALDGILRVAAESQNPRAYEVASNMIKNLGDVTDKLMLLQKQKKDLEGGKSAQAPTSVKVDKAVFVGSTAELLKKVKYEND